LQGTTSLDEARERSEMSWKLWLAKSELLGTKQIIPGTKQTTPGTNN
jgi:hypothetical protein